MEEGEICRRQEIRQPQERRLTKRKGCAVPVGRRGDAGFDFGGVSWLPGACPWLVWALPWPLQRPLECPGLSLDCPQTAPGCPQAP